MICNKLCGRLSKGREGELGRALVRAQIPSLPSLLNACQAGYICKVHTGNEDFREGFRLAGNDKRQEQLESMFS